MSGSINVDHIARDFEALFVGQMLRRARAASQSDGPLAGNGQFADMIDTARAELLAEKAPLGVARLLHDEDHRGTGRNDSGRQR